jgi:hypothetical protein
MHICISGIAVDRPGLITTERYSMRPDEKHTPIFFHVIILESCHISREVPKHPGDMDVGIRFSHRSLSEIDAP